MKKLSYSLIWLLTIFFVAVGCSKNGGDDDASSLLRTVPADASTVALFNVTEAVEKLGGKVDGSKITLPKEISEAIKNSQALNDGDRQAINDFIDGQTGMAFNTIVYFSAARNYITGLLDDPEKFFEYEQKQNPTLQWREEDGAKVMGTVAVIGNQYWVASSGTPDIEQLKYYQKLNDKQSYISSDAVSLLMDTDKAVTFVADVNKSIAYLPNSTYLRMGSSLIFNDMTYVAGYVDMEKKNIKASAAVLNSDMKPAEILLPIEKIDPAVIKSLGGGGDFVGAIGISEKLTKKISDLAGTAMGKGSKAFIGMLKAVDGTIAIKTNSSFDDVVAKVETNGQDFADLSNLLKSLLDMTVARDGNVLTAFRGNRDFTGPVSSDKAADKLKGAWIGVISDSFIARDVVMVARLVPEKKSLRLDIEAEGGVDAFLNAILK